MERQKNDTIINKNENGQNGFILPIVMIMMLFFAFFTMNAIERLDDERDFLHERQTYVELDLQKKIAVVDLLNLLSQDPLNKKGELNYSGAIVTYDITVPVVGVEMVSAHLNSANHQDNFSFYYDDKLKRITKWVD